MCQPCPTKVVYCLVGHRKLSLALLEFRCYAVSVSFVMFHFSGSCMLDFYGNKPHVEQNISADKKGRFCAIIMAHASVRTICHSTIM